MPRRVVSGRESYVTTSGDKLAEIRHMECRCGGVRYLSQARVC